MLERLIDRVRSVKNLLKRAKEEALPVYREADAALKSTLAACTAATDAEARALAPVNECAAAGRAAVHGTRAAWVAQFGEEVVRALSGGVERVDGTWVHHPGRLPDRLSGVLTGGVLTMEQLCVLLPGEVAAGLERLARDVPYQAGAPLAERLARLTTLDGEIAALKREHVGVVEEAEQGGIHLEHLEDEAARRALAAAAERRAAREAAVRERDKRVGWQR
jgi:hypothetical protein